jgi:hypothetical protein
VCARIGCATPRVTVDDVRWYIDNPGVFVWVENQTIVGFSAADPRTGTSSAYSWSRTTRGAGKVGLSSSVRAMSSSKLVVRACG